MSEKTYNPMRQFQPEWTEEIEVTETGGKHQALAYRFDLFDPHAMFALAKVLSKGAKKYGIDNWRLISAQDHMNHVLEHAFAWLAGDRSEPHAAHVLTRAMFVVAVENCEGQLELATAIAQQAEATGKEKTHQCRCGSSIEVRRCANCDFLNKKNNCQRLSSKSDVGEVIGTGKYHAGANIFIKDPMNFSCSLHVFRNEFAHEIAVEEEKTTQPDE